MALLVSCPSCKRRCSVKTKTCKCGVNLSKLAGKVYWVAYYDENRQYRRERVGPSKEAAQERERQVLSARCEGRIIRKNPDSTTLFRDLASWYLALPQIMSKRSYARDVVSLNNLLPVFGNKLLQQITPASIEAYRQRRLGEPSGRTPKTTAAPASINRELSTCRHMFNLAIAEGRAEANPCKVKAFKEHRRDRVLVGDEYDRLLAASPAHLQPIIKLAYHTGMRAGEILSLKWQQVDLQSGFIKLAPGDCKTGEGREVPLSQELIEMLKGLVRGLPTMPVFTYNGKPIKCLHRSFTTACRNAELTDFVFHDLRHCFNTNAFKAGVPIPYIMKITGHKSLSMFMRYTSITPQDLQEAIAKLG